MFVFVNDSKYFNSEYSNGKELDTFLKCHVTLQTNKLRNV